MSRIFEAIYENGVIRPAAPVVGLSEGQRVWVTMDEGEHLAAIRAGIDDLEAGRVVAFEDVDSRIRAKLGLPRRSESDMSQTTIGERVTRLEQMMDQLLRPRPQSSQPGRDDWLGTFGMFAGNPVMKEIIDAGRRIREEDN